MEPIRPTGTRRTLRSPRWSRRTARLALWAAALTAACASGPRPGSATSAVLTPASALQQAQVVVPEYRLAFGDVIAVRFFRNPEFDETLTVRPDGRISLPRLGDLDVAGRTPTQVDSIVTAAYSEFLVDPDVTVIVRQFSGYRVFVLGEVHTPGGYPMEHPMTVLQAVAVAGGSTIKAKLGSVMVLRRVPGDEVRAIKVDLTHAATAHGAEGIAGADLMMQPQDVVFVPKTLVGSTADFMQQVYDGFLPPLDIYLRALLYYN